MLSGIKLYVSTFILMAIMAIFMVHFASTQSFISINHIEGPDLPQGTAWNVLLYDASVLLGYLQFNFHGLAVWVSSLFWLLLFLNSVSIIAIIRGI